MRKGNKRLAVPIHTHRAAGTPSFVIILLPRSGESKCPKRRVPLHFP
jgi:hypothetical protein